jgi:hypothetical protein
MAKIAFEHYLREGKESGYDFAEELMVEHNLDLTEDQIRDLAYSFYEIKLYCIFDTDTMRVTIGGAE